MKDDTSESTSLRTLHLPPRELAKARELAGAMYHNREGRPVRYPYEVLGGIGLAVIQADGHRISYLVDPVNLSRTGIAVLHGNFVYIDTPCELCLKTVDGERLSVEGEVARSECISAPVHLLGIHFAQEIDVENFVDMQVESGSKASSRAVDKGPDTPQCTGLVADPALLECALIQLGKVIHAEQDIDLIRAQYNRFCAQFDLPIAPSTPAAERGGNAHADNATDDVMGEIPPVESVAE